MRINVESIQNALSKYAWNYIAAVSVTTKEVCSKIDKNVISDGQISVENGRCWKFWVLDSAHWSPAQSQ